MLSLVVLALDLNKQSYDDMLFWFAIIPKMGVEILSQAFQIPE